MHVNRDCEFATTYTFPPGGKNVTGLASRPLAKGIPTPRFELVPTMPDTVSGGVSSLLPVRS